VGFRRALGPFDATMVVIGGIIGSGIFINPYIVAGRLDTSPLVLGAWVAGGLIALAGAFAYAELGAIFPKAGGQYVYLIPFFTRSKSLPAEWAEDAENASHDLPPRTPGSQRTIGYCLASSASLSGEKLLAAKNAGLWVQSMNYPTRPLANVQDPVVQSVASSVPELEL